MGDQDPTPKFSRGLQGSENRDLAVRRRRTASPFGIKAYQAPAAAAISGAAAGEVTSPFELLEDPPDPAVHAVIERSPRNAKDPAYFEDVAKLAVMLTRERTGNRQRELDAEEVLREPARAARGSRRNLIITAITAAISLAGAIDHRLSHIPSEPAEVVRDLQHQHEQECEQQQRDRQLERAQFQHEIDRLDAELRAVRDQLGRRSEIDPLVSAGASPALTTTQGTFP